MKLTKFKNRLLIEHIIKTILAAVSITLAIDGLLILITKLFGIFNIIPVIIVSVLTFILSGILYYRHCNPSEEEIAKRLDKDFHLNEKCQTMVEYKDKHSLIIDKQRSDAENTVSNYDPKDIKLKTPVAFIILAALSMALCTGCCFTPQVFDSPIANHRDNWNDIVSSIVDQIKSNISENISNSSLQEQLNSIVDDLQSNLQSVSDVSERQELVDSAKNQVDSAVSEANQSANEQEQSANNDVASDAKEKMDDMVDPSSSETSDNTSGNTTDGSNSGSATEGSGSGSATDGSGSGSGDGSGSGSATDGSGSGSGDGSGSGSGSGEGEGSGEGSGSGSGSGKGSGSGSGEEGQGAGGGGNGDVSYGADDQIYDGSQQTEYGDVIDNYHNGALADADTAGDKDIEDIIADYFDELYRP